MPLHELARHLEGQGRGGDTMLMHVNPTELQVLEAMFGKTTTNPDTGLPEAFSWKKLLGAIALGVAAIPSGGLSLLGTAGIMSGIGAGAMTGLGVSAAAALASSAMKPGNKKTSLSEASKYLDERNAQKVKDQYQFAPPMTMLSSLSQKPDLLGRQHNWYQPPIAKMGQGLGEEEVQASLGGYAQGGRITEADAKRTVLSILDQMQSRQQMSHGRMVSGGGTGLSDSVPAELSVDEYVIPADVVSMMGDGSSQAGGKRLDALVAKIRMEKTGTKKQAGKLPMEKVMHHG